MTDGSPFPGTTPITAVKFPRPGKPISPGPTKMFVSQSCMCICDVLYPMICVYDLHRNLEPFLPQKESKGFSLLKIKTVLSVLLDSMGILKFAIWLEFSSLLRPLIYTLYPMKNVRKPVMEGETARPVHGGWVRGGGEGAGTAFLRQTGGVDSYYLLGLSLEIYSILVNNIRTLEHQR